MNPVEIQVTKATGVKCPRCWHYHEASQNFGHNLVAGADPKLAEEHLCNKCLEIILEHFPNHESVPFILSNFEARGLKRSDNPEYGKH